MKLAHTIFPVPLNAHFSAEAGSASGDPLANSLSDKKTRSDHRLADRHPLKILFVDDSAMNRLIGTRMLEHFGYQPTVTSSGAEAVELASRMTFDLVFLDMQMPGVDGTEAARRLRRHEAAGVSRAFIVALTASVSGVDRQACLASGMDDFLTKPAYLDDLRTTILRAAVVVGSYSTLSGQLAAPALPVGRNQASIAPL